jgi:CubicO group peptidase (beta-lactamase class C family)
MLTLPKTAALLEEGVAKEWHAGAQLYVSLKGDVKANWCCGEMRAGVPMHLMSRTLWLSAGKPLLALAVALLLDEGDLNLDEPIVGSIPKFGSGGKNPLTLRHLLTHTAGFRSADRVPEDLPWEQTIDAICACPLEEGWRIGEQAGYQIWSSWHIMAELVRLKSEMYNRYIRKNILSALGLASTYPAMDESNYAADEATIAWMYLGGDSLRPHPTLNTPEACLRLRPGSNTRGPIQELGRFYEALLEMRQGSRLISPLRPETVFQFTSAQRKGLYDLTFRHDIDWGFGFLVNTNGHRPVPYGYGKHASAETFGHGGAQSTSAYADPAHGLVVAWTCNGMPGEIIHQRRAHQINTLIYEELGLCG